MPTTKIGTKYHHGPCAPVLGGEKTREVLVDEEEIEELGVARRHDDEPGRGEREKIDGTGSQMQPPPQAQSRSQSV